MPVQVDRYLSCGAEKFCAPLHFYLVPGKSGAVVVIAGALIFFVVELFVLNFIIIIDFGVLTSWFWSLLFVYLTSWSQLHRGFWSRRHRTWPDLRVCTTVLGFILDIWSSWIHSLPGLLKARIFPGYFLLFLSFVCSSRMMWSAFSRCSSINALMSQFLAYVLS